MTKRRRLATPLTLLVVYSLLAVSCGDDANSDTASSADPTSLPADDDSSVANADIDVDPGGAAGVAGDGDSVGNPAAATPAATGDTIELTRSGGLLALIQARGVLNCGVSSTLLAFSVIQPDGSRRGFDADWCRAIAAAILGDAGSVNFVTLSTADRFIAIQTGEVDVLMHNTARTQSRDTDVGMDFGPTTYYDGQQIMGRASDGFDALSTVAELGGKVICTKAGLAERNLADAADAAGVAVTVSPFEDFDLATQNFIDGGCDLISTDGASLVAGRVDRQPADQDWVIFPSTPISKDPLGPIYGQNDSVFADVVNWTIYAAIIADENGVTSANVDDMAANPPTAEIARLLGGQGELQTLMGLEADAFLHVIKQVGNYDEIFARHLEPVGIIRAGSANARWTEGGLIYAPPAR